MQKGLYTQVLETTEELDKAVWEFAEGLTKFNPEAMAEMKKTFWVGTEDWDELLEERAAISGRLVLSDFTKKTLDRSEEHTSELQSRGHLVCRLLLEKKKV